MRNLEKRIPDSLRSKILQRYGDRKDETRAQVHTGLLQEFVVLRKPSGELGVLDTTTGRFIRYQLPSCCEIKEGMTLDKVRYVSRRHRYLCACVQN